MLLTTILIFLALLAILVLVHEVGHFVVARWCGMRVEEFGLGFPPRLWSWKKGETTYSLNLIPLGGFVRILGEEGDHGADPRSFVAKRPLYRFFVLIAGITMNLILAWVLLTAGFMVGMPAAVDAVPQGATLSGKAVRVMQVAQNSPAAEAGLQTGDALQMIDGVPIATTDAVSRAVDAQVGKEIVVTYERGGVVHDVRLTPRTNPPANQGPTGISVGLTGLIRYPWWQAFGQGAIALWGLLSAIVVGLYGLLASLLTGHGASAGLSGPVGIAVLTGQVAQLGFAYLMYFAAVLSVNLALLNVLPFPALDGGRILFVLIEMVRRGKPVSRTLEQKIHVAGFAFLILLVIVVTIRDIRNLF